MMESQDDFDEEIIIPDEDGLDESDSSGDGPLLEYKHVYDPPKPFKSDNRRIFFNRSLVEVKFLGYEDRPDGPFSSRYLYRINLKCGDHEWTIFKRHSHIRSLHTSLGTFSALLRMKLMNKTHEERRKSFALSKHSVAKLPRKPEALLDDDELDERMRDLERYLQSVVNVPEYRNSHGMIRFLELTPYSFISTLGNKNVEGMVKKKAGGRRVGCCKVVWGWISWLNWRNRWLLVKDTFVAYINPDDGLVREVLLMDQDFNVKCGLMDTGYDDGLLISNMSRHLLVRCDEPEMAKTWKEHILKVAHEKGKEFLEHSQARHWSFAPKRPMSYASWYVDGATYMAAVADAMESAKVEIFITDWWFSPEIYMKRPMTEGNKWRLDVILQRKATQGVKIFVLIYKEMEMALGLNSFYTKKALMKLHPTNIKVMRHPDGINYWSHHEKSVIIDQRIAFLGGIDLCYGRWDTPEHRLTDVGSVQPSTSEPAGLSEFYINDMNTSLSGEDNDKLATPFPDYGTMSSQHTWPKGAPHPSNEPGFAGIVSEAIKHNLRKGSESGGDDGSGSPAVDPHCPVSLNIIPETPEVQDSDVKHVHLDIPEISEDIMPQENIMPKEDPAAEALSVLTQAALNKNVSQPETNTQESDNSAILKPSSNSIAQVKDVLTTCHRTVQYGSFTIRVPSFDVGREVDMKNLVTEEDMRNTPSSANMASLMPKDIYDRGTSSSSTSRSSSSSSLSSQEGASAVSYDYGAGVNNNDRQKDRKKHSKGDIFGSNRAVQNGKSELSPSTAATPEKSPSRTRRKLSQLAKMWRSSVRQTDPPEGPHGFRRAQSTSDSSSSSSSRSKLHRQEAIEGDIDSNDPVRLQPGMLRSHSTKPVTPPSKRKFVQKAQELQMRLRRARSKSIDIDALDDYDLSLVRAVNEREKGSPDKILKGMGLAGSTKIWIGKDYTNFIAKDFVDLDKPFTDFIDRTKTPRMPWHDIGAVVYGKAARDVGRHFIQRWNVTKTEKRKTHEDYPLLLPMAHTNIRIPRSVLNSAFPVECQILRSSSQWSAGMKHTEQSIHQAYLSCIENAKHYIYIENQFFVSVEGNTVQNEICSALFKRIKKAFDQGETFRVYIVMPLLPAFEGELGTNGGLAIQAIIHWNYASMCRGDSSLYGKLAMAGVPEPMEYVTFYGLRNHSELMGTLTSELIYVHSKLMIVDDDTVITGSANINDRSMLGTRDSELAVLIKDKKRIRSRMNGKEYEAGWFASTMRKHIFKEHLGLLTEKSDRKIDVSDPVIESFYKGTWLAHATINTSVYEEVFRCLPTDSVRTFPELNAFKRANKLAETDVEKAKEELKKIQGHLVLMPTLFLDGVNLLPSVASKEGMVPTLIWI